MQKNLLSSYETPIGGFRYLSMYTILDSQNGFLPSNLLLLGQCRSHPHPQHHCCLLTSSLPTQGVTANNASYLTLGDNLQGGGAVRTHQPSNSLPVSRWRNCWRSQGLSSPQPDFFLPGSEEMFTRLEVGGIHLTALLSCPPPTSKPK